MSGQGAEHYGVKWSATKRGVGWGGGGGVGGGCRGDLQFPLGPQSHREKGPESTSPVGPGSHSHATTDKKKKKRPYWTRIRRFRSGELNSDFLPQSITQVSSPYPPSASDERTHCFSAPHRNELVVFFCFFGCVFFLLLSVFFRHGFGAAENASLILVWGELFCLLIRSIYNIPCRVSKERLAISVNIHMIGIS